MQGWEWIFGEGIAEGVLGAVVVRGETKIFPLEEKMPKPVLGLVIWFAADCGLCGV